MCFKFWLENRQDPGWPCAGLFGIRVKCSCGRAYEGLIVHLPEGHLLADYEAAYRASFEAIRDKLLPLVGENPRAVATLNDGEAHIVRPHRPYTGCSTGEWFW